MRQLLLLRLTVRWGEFIHLQTNDAICCLNGLINWGRVSHIAILVPDTESNEQVDQPGLGRVWSRSLFPYPPHSIVILAQHDITDRSPPPYYVYGSLSPGHQQIDRYVTGVVFLSLPRMLANASLQNNQPNHIKKRKRKSSFEQTYLCCRSFGGAR